jgi:hypothetical protein
MHQRSAEKATEFVPVNFLMSGRVTGGATPTTGMTHIAIQEHVNGKVVVWMEKVSDEQYLAKPGER